LLPDAIIGFAGDRPGHDFRYSLSCDKIHRLGWTPQVGFEEGLQKTIDASESGRLSVDKGLFRV
jgi:dTDP-glucose 4,6-dehydratase